MEDLEENQRHIVAVDEDDVDANRYTWVPTATEMVQMVASGHLPLTVWGSGEREFLSRECKYGPFALSEIKMPKGGVNLNSDFLMCEVSTVPFSLNACGSSLVSLVVL